LASRLRATESSDVTAQIQHAYQLLFARAAKAEELEICRKLLAASDGASAWSDLVHVLLCSNEFAYVD
jgi:hypothetical protein